MFLRTALRPAYGRDQDINYSSLVYSIVCALMLFIQQKRAAEDVHGSCRRYTVYSSRTEILERLVYIASPPRWWHIHELPRQAHTSEEHQSGMLTYSEAVEIKDRIIMLASAALTSHSVRWRKLCT
jgi:hypothetical protein